MLYHSVLKGGGCVASGCVAATGIKPEMLLNHSFIETLDRCVMWRFDCVFVSPGLWGNHPGCFYGQGLPCGVLSLWGETLLLPSLRPHTHSHTHRVWVRAVCQACDLTPVNTASLHVIQLFRLVWNEWDKTHWNVCPHSWTRNTCTHVHIHSVQWTPCTPVRAVNRGMRPGSVLYLRVWLTTLVEWMRHTKKTLRRISAQGYSSALWLTDKAHSSIALWTWSSGCLLLKPDFWNPSHPDS